MSDTETRLRDAVAKGLEAPRTNGLFSDTITNVVDALREAELVPGPYPVPTEPDGEVVRLRGIVQQDEWDPTGLNSLRLDDANRRYSRHRILLHFTVDVPRRLLMPVVAAKVQGQGA